MPNWKKVVTSGSDAYLNTLDTTHVKINNTSSLRESNSGNLLYLGNSADWVGIEYGRITGTYHKFTGEEILIPNIPVNNQTSTTGTNVLTYNSSTGQILATGSYGNAGSAGVGTLQQVTNQGNETTLPISASHIYVTSSGGSATVNVINRTDISPAGTAPGQFRIEGNGYALYNALDGTAAYIGHNSDLRDLVLQTNETNRLTIDGSTGNVGIMADISASNVTASIYDSPGAGGSYGYHVDSTSSLAKKNDALQVGVDIDWSGIRFNQLATQTNEFIGIMKLTQVANAASNAGTNVLTINSSTGQVYMTGSYGSGGGGSPGGNNKAVQFNNNGSFDGNSAFEYDNTNKTIDLNGAAGFTIDAAVSNGTLAISSSNDLDLFASNDMNLIFDTKFNLISTSNNASEILVKQTISNTLVETVNIGNSGRVTLSKSLAVGNITPNSTVGRIDASNDVVAFSTSDKRLKNNITPIKNALNKISQVQGIEFDWVEKEGVHGNEGHDVGVIAQEIEKVLPEVVTTRDSGYKAVKYEKIVPLLIESIKELKAEIEELKKSK